MREYAASQGSDVSSLGDDAVIRMIDIESGMQQKAQEFVQQGAEIYQKV